MTESNFKIYPLGGQEEVGRNCTVFEYDDDIVIFRVYNSVEYLDFLDNSGCPAHVNLVANLELLEHY